MKINIISYEDVDLWILGKFAKKMYENLQLLGYDVKISNEPDPLFDINHHIYYLDYKGIPNNIDTLMITHVDNLSKFRDLKSKLNKEVYGICMSHDTLNYLVNLGIERERLCFINPAHDNVIKTKKINIGITCRVQADGRKREYLIDEITDVIDPGLFKFTVMGDGWRDVLNRVEEKGFEVEYYEDFIYNKYISLFEAFDYYLYTGMDEGQMGFIDAAHAGIKTIVTRQGYHLDALGGLTYDYETSNELKGIFEKINKDKLALINSVKSWNWNDYTKKHLEIWKYLYNKKNDLNISFIPNYAIDGLKSHSDFATYDVGLKTSKHLALFKLLVQKLRHVYYLKVKNRNG